MKMSYATNRDQNGNRYILIVDHTKKEYSTTPAHWYCKEDYITISKTDRRKLLNILRASSDYTEKDTLTAEIIF